MLAEHPTIPLRRRPGSRSSTSPTLPIEVPRRCRGQLDPVHADKKVGALLVLPGDRDRQGVRPRVEGPRAEQQIAGVDHPGGGFVEVDGFAERIAVEGELDGAVVAGLREGGREGVGARGLDGQLEVELRVRPPPTHQS